MANFSTTILIIVNKNFAFSDCVQLLANAVQLCRENQHHHMSPNHTCILNGSLQSEQTNLL